MRDPLPLWGDIIYGWPLLVVYKSLQILLIYLTSSMLINPHKILIKSYKSSLSLTKYQKSIFDNFEVKGSRDIKVILRTARTLLAVKNQFWKLEIAKNDKNIIWRSTYKRYTFFQNRRAVLWLKKWACNAYKSVNFAKCTFFCILAFYKTQNKTCMSTRVGSRFIWSQVVLI